MVHFDNCCNILMPKSYIISTFKDNSCIVWILGELKKIKEIKKIKTIVALSGSVGKLMDKKATNCCVFVVRIFVLDYCLNKKSLTKNFD